MRNCLVTAFAIMLLGLMTGCGQAVGFSANSLSDEQRWVAGQGGLANNRAVEHEVQAICAGLTGSCINSPIRAEVIHSGDVAAWSWPDGHIYVTTGLVTHLSSPQIAAAMAHEMGHLINDHHVATVAGLTGKPNGTLGREAAADRTGCHVLLRHGIPAAEMITMLRIVARFQPCAVQANIARRITLLERRYVLRPPH